MEILFILLFVAVLLGFVIADISIVYALLIGYAIFFVYALKKGFGALDVLKMSASGILSAKNIIINFLLIGMLTALWRASGTIPSIVCYAVKIMHPSIIVVISFLLTCLVSFLTGTAFGTSATMGAICMTIALTLGVEPMIMGGAIISGAYFGDRCSPVSTSALLIAELTKTNLYDNIKKMLSSAVVPFAASCAFFTILGFAFSPENAQIMDVNSLFSNEFKLGLVPLIPAVLILILSFARLNVKITMLASILASAIICILYQNASPLDVLAYSFSGYEATNTAVAKMINGGGIVSMLRVGAIVCISSSYSGIFQKTPLLNSVKSVIVKSSQKISTYAVTLITSLVAASIACNQTLTIMLTDQLCNDMESDKKRVAIFLENSAVVVSSLFPWSIACRVPLDSVGAPNSSLIFAAFLILLPVWSLFIWRKKSNNKKTR